MFFARMPYWCSLTACPEPYPASFAFPVGIAKFRCRSSEPYLSRLNSWRQSFAGTNAFTMITLQKVGEQTSWIHIVAQKSRGEGWPSSETLSSASFKADRKNYALSAAE